MSSGSISSSGILAKTEVNAATDFPLVADAKFIYQVNVDSTVPASRSGAGDTFKSGDLLVWDADRGDGVGEYVVINNSNRTTKIPSNYALTANLVAGVVPNGYDGYRDYDGSWTANVTLPVLGTFVGQLFHVNNEASYSCSVQMANTRLTAALALSSVNKRALFLWDGAKWCYLK